jgi:hypothetical protein
MPRRRFGGWLAGGLLLAMAAAGGGWWVLHDVAPPAAPPPPRAPAPAIPSIPEASESQILADAGTATSVFRFALNPRVLVIDFATLHAQALMLNRVAALVEKAGLPRDRVLSEGELEQAIRASGATDDTYYYGHDYRTADLARFFRLAAQEAVALSPAELSLRDLLAQQGALAPDADSALITLPRLAPAPGAAGPQAPGLDQRGRAAILRHELSHGEYFTNPAYAAATRRFWEQILSPQERAMFTHFLTEEGYDPANVDLMMNETQAYLMHTPDPRFFNAAALGTTPAHVARLRAAFLQVMPPGWLHDMTPAPTASDP